MKRLVIIPAYNEEGSLPSVLAEVNSSLPGFDVIVVNDGSKDKTAQVAAKCGASVISHPVNIGYGAAVQTGFKYATSKAYQTVVILDADGQHDATDAPALVEALEADDADMVIGSRFIGKSKYKITFARSMGLKIFSLLTFLITRKYYHDISSGFQALNERAVTFLAKNYPIDFPDAEILTLMLLSGFQIAEVPAHFRQRNIGTSMFSLPMKIYYPFKGMLAIFIVVIRVYFSRGK